MLKVVHVKYAISKVLQVSHKRRDFYNYDGIQILLFWTKTNEL